MDELLELIEQRNLEEQRLTKQLAPIAVNFPYSITEVRSTYNLLRRHYNESESIDKTRKLCELAAGSGVAPSMLVLS